MTANWIHLPENRMARLAIQRVVEWLRARYSPEGKHQQAINPLMMHGPNGTGKSCLVGVLIAEVVREIPDLTVSVLTGNELASILLHSAEGKADNQDRTLEVPQRQGLQADLLIVEDLQQLPEQAMPNFAHLLDRRQARHQQVVMTASAGPAQLMHLPVRLVNRLAAGLVVHLEPFSPESRKRYLEQRARQLNLNLGSEELTWLANHLPGSARQLEGALTQVGTLLQIHPVASPDGILELLREHFQIEQQQAHLTIERIAQRVGRFYQIDPGQLQSRHRSRGILLPRQISMYLARQLTGLSLQQIGLYFGGRDHTTVLHGIRKVEQALTHDANLAGAVRQLHADLA